MFSWHAVCDLARMAQITSFRDLEVWLLSMDLVDDIIKAGRAMPRVEFDLRRQMTKAAISIPSNIAEGWKRKRKRAAYQEPRLNRDGLGSRTLPSRSALPVKECRQARTSATATAPPLSRARVAATPTLSASIPSSIVIGAGRPCRTFCAKFCS